MQGNF